MGCCIKNIFDRLRGCCHDLFYSDNYFKNLTDKDVSKLSHHILNRYNEKHFTAINPSYLSDKKVQNLNNNHLDYWIKSKQIDKVVAFLSDKQILYVVGNKGYFSDSLFAQLTASQFSCLSNLILKNPTLRNHFDSQINKMNAKGWADRWNMAAEKNDDILKALFMDQVNEERIKMLIPGLDLHALNNFIAFAEARFGKPLNQMVMGQTISKILQADSSLFDRLFNQLNTTQNALPTLNPVYQLLWANVSSQQISATYALNLPEKFIEAIALTLKDNLQFLQKISSDDVLRMIKKMAKIKMSPEVKKGMDQIFSYLQTNSALKADLKDKLKDLDVHQLASLLEYFPFQNDLKAEQIQKIVEEVDLSLFPRAFFHKNLDVTFQVLILICALDITVNDTIVKDTDKNKLFSKNLFVIFKGFSKTKEFEDEMNKHDPRLRLLISNILLHISVMDKFSG